MSPKQFLRNYGIFTGILVGFTLILFGFTFLTRPVWKKGLQAQIQTVLDRTCPGEYQVGGPVTLHSSFSSSSAVYLLIPAKTSAMAAQYGVITRVPTLFGPMPGVFFTDPAGAAHFAGFAFHFERFEESFSKSLFYPHIDGLEKQIRGMLVLLNIPGASHER